MTKSAREMMGAPPSTASPSDSTLIIIDAQNEYAEGALKVTDAPGTRKVIASLLEKYRSAGGQIVHVVHNVPEGTPIFTPGTALAKEFEELTPKDGEKVIEKIHPSSFADTTLHDYLRGTGGKKIVLTGYMAHVCVSTTARDAARLGYDVLIAEDAVGDRDIPGASGAEVTKMVMHELADFFATIVQSKDIKATVKTPYFQIHTIKGVRSKEEIRKLADVVQQCSLDHFNAPPKHRYQIITQHEEGELICEDTNLGLKRTEKLVFIQIFQQWRDAETKQALYSALADRLKAECGLDGNDLIVTVSRNEKEDWSFGKGKAQFLTGDL